jgi:hypothetical protein
VKLKLYQTFGRKLIVANSKADAFRVMREEWGESFPIKAVTRSVKMTSDDEDEIMMRPSEVVARFPRGLVPQF